MSDINKEDMKKVIESLVNAFKQEKQTELKDIIDIFKNLNIKPKNFYLFFMFNLRTAIESVYGKNNVDIILYYNIFECNIENVISTIEGTCCCADKANYLISKYFEWKNKNEIIDFSTKKKEEFWIPNNGTFFEWMDFIDSIKGLIYGNFEKYMECLKTLLIYSLK
jgi:hypothetical protein